MSKHHNALKLQFISFLLLCNAQAYSAPFIPASDSVVLEQLPFKASDPTSRELRHLRNELSANPLNLEKAISLAQRYFQLAMANGDPRFIGYAQAALAPWWELDKPPVAVLVQRATLRQYTHNFTSALADLNHVIRMEPRNGTAWSLLAAINMVQAEYATARENCENLHGLASKLIVVACIATVDSLSGKAAQAYRSLQETYHSSTVSGSTIPANEKLWVLTRLAEMSDRLGYTEKADAYFQSALKLNIPDAYLLAVYAEFLLDEKRYSEVITLLKDKERSDILLMRLALAEKALNAPRAAEHQEVMRSRFDAARMRGDKLHIQDEARFYLYFLAPTDGHGDDKTHLPHPNPPPRGEGTNESLREFYLKEALRLAQENWLGQHEPSDARILMAAALATGDLAAAQPALDWLAQSRIEDRHLEKLRKAIKELKS